MSNKFFDYVAEKISVYFTSHDSSISYGERFCLRLDDEETVKDVIGALRKLCQSNKRFKDYSIATPQHQYETFALQCEHKNVVFIPKVDGMTDDFLATLRNCQIEDPILIIAESVIDSISSGTYDLSAKNMPFHIGIIQDEISAEIDKSYFSEAVKTILKVELNRKNEDRFNDKTSLLEYGNIIEALRNGDEGITTENFYRFSLLHDEVLLSLKKKKEIEDRLERNHAIYDKISEAFQNNNLDDLENQYGPNLVKQLKEFQKEDKSWQDHLQYEDVLKSQEKLKATFEIYDDDKDIVVTMIDDNSSESKLDFFLHCDSSSKAKARRKYLLIFNPSASSREVDVTIKGTSRLSKDQISSKSKRVETVAIGKKGVIKIATNTRRTVFAKIKISSYTFNVCVVPMQQRIFECLRSKFFLSKDKIQIVGAQDEYIFNAGASRSVKYQLNEQEETKIDFQYNTEITITLPKDFTEKVDCIIQNVDFQVPLQFTSDSNVKQEITWNEIFEKKWSFHESLDILRINRIEQKSDQVSISILTQSQEYIVRSEVKRYLELEYDLIQNKRLAVEITSDGKRDYTLKGLPQELKDAYLDLLQEIQTQLSLPSLLTYKGHLRELAIHYVHTFKKTFEQIFEMQGETTLSTDQSNWLFLGCVFNKTDHEEKILFSPLHPLNVAYQLQLSKEKDVALLSESSLTSRITPLYLLPYLYAPGKVLFKALESPANAIKEWQTYVPYENQKYAGARSFVAKLFVDKVKEYVKHFEFLFKGLRNNEIIINLVNLGDCNEILGGLIGYYGDFLKDKSAVETEPLQFTINIYSNKDSESNGINNISLDLTNLTLLRNAIDSKSASSKIDKLEILRLLTQKVKIYLKKQTSVDSYAHITFYEMGSVRVDETTLNTVSTGATLGGLLSTVPSIHLADEWHRTCFGTKNASNNELITLAKLYNALFRVAFNGLPFNLDYGISTSVNNTNQILRSVYQNSNWVVFISPEVDLSFFDKDHTLAQNDQNNLLIIHYSDQYTPSNGYDAITVTQKINQYQNIIQEWLSSKYLNGTGQSIDIQKINSLIQFFNAFNGMWMLKLLASDEVVDGNHFTREKISVLAAVKLCMAYYCNPNIIWIPISLEELLRVSGAVGLSKNDGMLSAKNLGFTNGPTCDDVLFVGVEKTSANTNASQKIKVHLHTVEVKIGNNATTTLEKAFNQATNTYDKLYEALVPSPIEEDNLSDSSSIPFRQKILRNFIMQTAITTCKKMKLYGVTPEVDWDYILESCYEALLNENYQLSQDLEKIIGKGTIVSFRKDAVNATDDWYCDSDKTHSIRKIEIPESQSIDYTIEDVTEIGKSLKQKRLLDVIARQYASYFQDRENCEAVVPSFEEINEESMEDEAPKEAEEEQNNEVQDVTTPSKTMSIVFGTDTETGNLLVWRANDTNQCFNPNIGIIGTMGTGKTQFNQSLIVQLYQEQKNNFDGSRLGILIFDYKGDYNEKKKNFCSMVHPDVRKPHKLPFNPFSLEGQDFSKPVLPYHVGQTFVTTLSKIYGLGKKQESILSKCIMSAYECQGIYKDDSQTWSNVPPTLDLVYQIYQENDEIPKGDSLEAALNSLVEGYQVFESNPQYTKSLFSFLNGVVVIDLSGYDAQTQTLVVAITLDLFYSQMHAKGASKFDNRYRQLTKLILVDEADNFMSQDFVSLKKILKEGREFGVGVILSTQYLKHFTTDSESYASYIQSWIVHQVSDLTGKEVKSIFKIEDGEEQELFQQIKKLAKFHSITQLGQVKLTKIEDKPFWKLFEEQ